MKKLLVFFSTVLLLAAVFYSCKKLVAAIFGGTDVSAPEVQVTVPAIPFVTANEIEIGTFSFQFNLDSIVKANTGGVFGVNAVNSIKVKQVVVNITNADQLNNLANFESARVSLKSDVNSTPVQIFSATFPDTYASTATYTPANNPELLPYLKGAVISYTIYGKLRRITSKPLNIVVAVTLRAD